MKQLLGGALFGIALCLPGTLVTVAQDYQIDRLVIGAAVVSLAVVGGWLLALAERDGRVQMERKQSLF